MSEEADGVDSFSYYILALVVILILIGTWIMKNETCAGLLALSRTAADSAAIAEAVHRCPRK